MKRFLLLIALLLVLTGCGQTVVESAPPSPTPTATPVPTPTPNLLEGVLLVNRENLMPEDVQVEIVNWGDGQMIGAAVMEPLKELMTACVEAGYKPYMVSGYRTIAEQAWLFENKKHRVQVSGQHTPEEVEALAAKSVAPPGTSEHHTGMAVDIIDRDYQMMDAQQEQRPVQQWLMAHCHEYGFILRYPNGHTDCTGIEYEPWHYRYVGKPLAAEITASGLCLEEYFALYAPN